MAEYQAYNGPSASDIADRVRSYLADDFRVINGNIAQTHNQVLAVGDHVDDVDARLRDLEDELLSFVREQRLANRLGQAETRVVNIRQELEKKYGHYDKIRKTLIGMLEASDLALVRKGSMTTASENLFMETPHYWLAPCLVALAAWINDDQDLANKAVKEALKRNSENTSLFFALLTRRADRFQPSFLWVQTYLAVQNEEDLNRNALIILEALVCGLWGNDTEGAVSAQFKSWIDKLESRENFYEEQVNHWKTALLNKRRSTEHAYAYLKKYSPTWLNCYDILNGADLHATVDRYFHNIFNKKVEFPDFKTMLDESLTHLVTNYDDEELPLRKKEHLESLIIQYNGDEKRAQAQMDSENTLFETRKNFMQLLLEAAMHPEQSEVNMAVTKFAVAVSKYYIYDAYNDIASQNRANVPENIEFVIPEYDIRNSDIQTDCKVSKFVALSADGSNENQLISSFDEQIENDRKVAKDIATKDFQDNYSKARRKKTWGIILTVIGIPLIFVAGLGFVFIIIGICLIIKGYFEKNALEAAFKKAMPAIEQQYNDTKTTTEQIIRAYCAEVVDFRDEFKQKDAKAIELLDYIETLEGNEFIHVPCERKRVLA